MFSAIIITAQCNNQLGNQINLISKLVRQIESREASAEGVRALSWLRAGGAQTRGLHLSSAFFDGQVIWTLLERPHLGEELFTSG